MPHYFDIVFKAAKGRTHGFNCVEGIFTFCLSLIAGDSNMFCVNWQLLHIMLFHQYNAQFWITPPTPTQNKHLFFHIILNIKLQFGAKLIAASLKCGLTPTKVATVASPA